VSLSFINKTRKKKIPELVKQVNKKRLNEHLIIILTYEFGMNKTSADTASIITKNQIPHRNCLPTYSLIPSLLEERLLAIETDNFRLVEF